jgi:glycerol-3-phosphate dehydrogenase
MFRSLPTTVNISGNNKTDINKTAILFNKANKNFSVVKINNTKNMQILSIIKNIYAILMGSV